MNLLVWITFSFESNKPFKIDGLRSNDILELFSSFLKFCLFTYFSRIFRHECNSQILENLCSVDQPIQNSSLIYELKLRFNLIFFNTMDQKRQKFEMEVTFYLISKSQFFSILVLSWWEVGHDRHNAENTIINSNFHSSVVFSFST